MAETRAAISLKSFLETTAPGGDVTTIPGLGGKTYQSGAVQFAGPDITLFCDFEQCNGFRLFKDISEPNLEAGVVKQAFVSYRCKNCSAKTKVSTHPTTSPSPMSDSTQSPTASAPGSPRHHHRLPIRLVPSH